MSYNTTFTRFKSADLAGLDCGTYLKIPRRQGKVTLVASYTGDLEVGQCAAMVRVPTGARIVAADVSWSGASNSILAVGDPYACGRLLGPISTVYPRGVMRRALADITANCVNYQPWGTCGTMTKTGNIGDGCGLFYQYTCETDIVVTNLYSEANANAGGWAGGGVVAGSGSAGAKWTGGSIVLTVEYLQQS